MAPPVPIGKIPNIPGLGSWEDLSVYNMTNFQLSPGSGGKFSGPFEEDNNFVLNGGGGGGVLINPVFGLPWGGPKNKTFTEDSVLASSPNNGQGYGGGQGGSQTGTPGPGAVLLEIV